MDEKKKPLLSRPKDESLQAFKDWIIELTIHLTGKTDDSMTDEKFEEAWKKFWKKEK